MIPTNWWISVKGLDEDSRQRPSVTVEQLTGHEQRCRTVRLPIGLPSSCHSVDPQDRCSWTPAFACGIVLNCSYYSYTIRILFVYSPCVIGVIIRTKERIWFENEIDLPNVDRFTSHWTSSPKVSCLQVWDWKRLKVVRLNFFGLKSKDLEHSDITSPAKRKSLEAEMSGDFRAISPPETRRLETVKVDDGELSRESINECQKRLIKFSLSSVRPGEMFTGSTKLTKFWSKNV